MKKLLQEMLFLDERTGKFSTSKFMTLVSFYFIMGLTARSVYLDKEVKDLASLEQTFMICSTLYFGRRFNFKTKNMELGGDSVEKDN
jgi:hypothetical protein